MFVRAIFTPLFLLTATSLQAQSPEQNQEKPKTEVAETKKEEEKDKNKEKDKDPKPKEPAFLIPFTLADCGSITFKPGLRIQVRYMYEEDINNHDFFIRRFRFKCGGDAFGLAKYYTEFKIDNVGRFRSEPFRADLETAWLDFILCPGLSYLRVGLYDLPFSRDALTSDAKLLFMDRTLIKEALTDLGLTDNAIGVMWHGRPYGGHLEYYFGIFDSQRFERFGEYGTRHSKHLMPAGRVVINFWDPMEPPDGYGDYQESYLGIGQRLALAINAAYLHEAEDFDRKFDLYGWGTDLFYNQGPYTLQAEFDWFTERFKHESDLIGYGWYVQGGYLFLACVELAARYQELVPDRDFHGHIQWASLGLNLYMREHSLKVQTDYTWKRNRIDDFIDHVFEIQLQLDF